MLLGAGPSVATGATLTVDGVSPPEKIAVAPGTTVTVAVSGGPGFARDWVALYREGNSGSSYVTWKYSNGSQTAPTGSGPTNFSLTFTIPATPIGNYYFVLYQNNSFTSAGSSSTVYPAWPPATVTVNGSSAPIVVPRGRHVSVAVSNGPGYANDWVGLFATSATNQQSSSYQYMGAGVTSKTFDFAMPDSVGEYEFRFFWNNTTFPVVGKSNTVTVQALTTLAVNTVKAPVTLFVPPSTTVTVDLTNGPALMNDWVGLFPVGAANTGYISYQYLPQFTESATFQFTLPSTNGSYEFRFFPRNSYDNWATSGKMTAGLSNTEVVTFYHTDAIGSVRVITDSGGQQVGDRHDYTPFGEEWPGTSASDPRRFAGKDKDAETGFDYFGARHYASGGGRFTTVDPSYAWSASLADPQLWNRYAYARNNPLRYTDPDGRCIWDFCVTEIAAATGLSTATVAAFGVASTTTAWLLSPPGRRATAAAAESLAKVITDGTTTLQRATADTLSVVFSKADPGKGLRDQIALHEKKLADYLRDPDAHDNKGFLKNADPERRAKIIDARIRELRRQIEEFKKQLERMAEQAPR